MFRIMEDCKHTKKTTRLPPLRRVTRPRKSVSLLSRKVEGTSKSTLALFRPIHKS